MKIETLRLALVPLSEEQLKRAKRNICAVAGEFGLTLEPYGFFEMRRKRRNYKIKLDIIRTYPLSWLLTTPWFVYEKETNTVVAEAGFKGPPQTGEVEIGYYTKPFARNKGYMTEAVAALCDMLKHIDGYSVETVMARTRKDNTASHRVLEKNGFMQVGTLGKHLRWVKRTL